MTREELKQVFSKAKTKIDEDIFNLMRQEVNPSKEIYTAQLIINYISEAL